MLLLTAILLGIVEGVTEFLPVSSTGHLILASELLGYDAAQWATFNVVIQLGAILAVVVVYWRTFWAVLLGMGRGEPMSWRFTRNVLVAVLPAIAIGVVAKDAIHAMLGAPIIVAVALVVGGIAILIIERVVKPGNVHGVAEISLKQSLGIGFIQCLAMVPGVSRSGASILGALCLGVERRTAAEFSFFLAIPTMLGATAKELFDSRAELAAGQMHFGLIAVGFITAFIVALVVIRWFVGIVSRHGFAPFAWYRIIVGGAALIWLLAR